MTTELRRRFIDDMTLRGLAPTTQNVYVNAVRQLAGRYGRSPDQLSEQELRDYFTYLIKEKRLASSTLRTQTPGPVHLQDCLFKQPTDLYRSRPGNVPLSDMQRAPVEDDDAGRRRVPSAILAARPSSWHAQGAILWHLASVETPIAATSSVANRRQSTLRGHTR